MNSQLMLGFDRVDEVERDFRGLLQTVPNNLTCYSTHGLHYYPAKFIPQLPGFFIERFSQKGDLVVDPMCGAGTTLIEAAMNERRFWGGDIDPIGALISRVATTPFAGCETKAEFEQKVRRLLVKVWDALRGQQVRTVALPDEKEFPNASIWFRDDVLRELLVIRDIVLEENEDGFRDFCLLSLSSIVREVSNSDPRDIFPQRDSANPIRVRRNPLKEFENAVWEKFEKVVSFSQRIGNQRLGEAECADAREIPVEDGSAQLVFTSPPYAYAIDYARVQQLSTLLLCMRNEEFKEYRRKYVGTDRVSAKSEIRDYDGIEFIREEIERVVDSDKKCGVVLHQYFKDMYAITKECYRIICPGGYLIYVVGNSTVRKTTFKTNEVFRQLCENAGFKIEKMLERPYYIYRMSRKRNTHSNTVKSDFFVISKKV